jgi:hypothetical protein
MATDFTIILEDRPGELARVGEALGKAGVNVEGVAAAVTDGRGGVLHLAVEDADGARAALDSAGLEVARETDALLFDISAYADTPGSLGVIARKIADAGVNIEALYLAHDNRNVLVSSDNEAARAALA